MDQEVWDNVKLIMEKIKPFIALAVLILIIFSSFNLYKYNKLQTEVKESCGYEKSEDVYCICDKDYVSLRDAPGNPYYNGSDSFDGNLKLPEGFGN